MLMMMFYFLSSWGENSTDTEIPIEFFAEISTLFYFLLEKWRFLEIFVISWNFCVRNVFTPT